MAFISTLFKMWPKIFILCLMAFKVNWTKTPLTKCCANNQVYMTELDVCRKIGNKSWKGNNNSKLLQSPLPDIDIIRRDTGRVFVGEHNFEIKHQLHLCPKGYVGTNSANFTFYEDGSIHSVTDDLNYNQGEFCIHESFSTGLLVARYCIPDPCSRTNICIRKCCPDKMAFNSLFKKCQNYTKPLNVTLYNHNGFPITSQDSYFERDGLAPKCQKGYELVFRDQNCYQLRTNGWLHLSSDLHCSTSGEEDRHVLTEDYCIDHFGNNGTWKQSAMVCIQQEEETRKYWVPTFMVISAIFLVATFVVYALIPEIRNIHGVVIMCYVGSRALAELIFGVLLIIEDRTSAICRTLSILIHFSYISTYTWLNVVCFDIWWTLRSMKVNSCINQANGQNLLGKSFLAYSLYSWGVAGIIVTIGQLLDEYKKSLPDYIIRPGFGENYCWFSGYKSMFAYVYGPVCLLVLSDIVFFVMTTILIRRAGIGSNSRHSRERYRLRVIFSLFLLKVVSWIAELIAYGTGSLTEASYPIVILETVSSILTFIIFVCKANVWQLFKKKCPCLERLEKILPCCKQSPDRQNSCNATHSTMVSSRELLHRELSVCVSRSHIDAVNIPL